MNIAIVSIVTLVVNLLLGRYRIRYRKMSLMWWVIIHASLPLVIPLRIWLDTPNMTIPIFIALAVIGQIIGSRIRWKTGKR
ncbi:hypothetical protein [Tannerella sp.]|uniref:hypothetical protein n=1 Tax=Tannerella sp. TaxID=2382127 RepID=UPI003FA24FB1